VATATLVCWLVSIVSAVISYGMLFLALLDGSALYARHLRAAFGRSRKAGRCGFRTTHEKEGNMSNIDMNLLKERVKNPVRFVRFEYPEL